MWESGVFRHEEVMGETASGTGQGSGQYGAEKGKGYLGQ